MLFYDTHMHSKLSFDSKAEPTSYVKDKIERLTFTDHLDLDHTINDMRDEIPDFDTLFSWKADFKEKYQIDLLAGIEVGYVPGQKERLDEILNSHDFDIKLLSCHQNDVYDYMDDLPDEKPEDMMTKYVDQLLKAVTMMPDTQILTHFDYGFRVHDVSLDELEPYKAKLTQVFEKAVENDLALELNSKSIVKHHNTDSYEWAIQTYQSLGGTLFSLGSDAHQADDHFLAFDQLIELLEKFDIEKVVQYKNQELSFVTLDEVKAFIG